MEQPVKPILEKAMNEIVDGAPVPDVLSRACVLAALKRDVEKPSGANLGKKAKANDAHALAMLAVRYPQLAKELSK